jgi:hypothetical protein
MEVEIYKRLYLHLLPKDCFWSKAYIDFKADQQIVELTVYYRTTEDSPKRRIDAVLAPVVFQDVEASEVIPEKEYTEWANNIFATER